MRKNGFTLAEVLLTMAIIGVVAALVAPAIGSIMPDRNKVMVLKAYKTLYSINHDLLNDPGIYWAGGSCTGLSCTEKPLSDEFADAKFSGSKKYLNLLAANMELEGDVGSDGTFKTVDGLSWKVQGYSKVTIDVNGFGKGVDKSTSSAGAKQDQFVFNIDANGNVSGGDTITKRYLKNKYKLNDRETDYKGYN